MNNGTQPGTGQLILNKVPEVTLMFWLVKMMSTTVGETAADFLNFNLNFGLTATSVVVAVLTALALAFQLRTKRYTPSVYWLSIVLISVLGTLITDHLTDNLGVPLMASTAAFSLALACVFALWHRREGTLSIHHIDTRAREWFYWLAILVTFALGTASGDWFAEGLNLGYANSTMVFGALIAMIAIARFRFNMNAVWAFWLGYILTRPLGASLGDLLSQPAVNGGLGLGTTQTSLVFLALIVGSVGCFAYQNKKLSHSK
ncbi:hypothetical protein [Limnobacter sp.]|uniref:COG4705 family protein n=1 Tax=Limnobacter sp. TaxID=2003368 RepID=UPI002732D626|nr:hypothetical protein [Limnobacter sp.]MDP3188606.1 hypothetical protein [Limnobacter sp.]